MNDPKSKFTVSREQLREIQGETVKQLGKRSIMKWFTDGEWELKERDLDKIINEVLGLDDKQ